MERNYLIVKLVDKILEKNEGMSFLDALDIARDEVNKMNLFQKGDFKNE